MSILACISLVIVDSLVIVNNLPLTDESTITRGDCIFSRKEFQKMVLQLTLVIVDSFVSDKLSTITRESTIMREIYAKIDIWSAQSIHYNKRIHY